MTYYMLYCHVFPYLCPLHGLPGWGKKELGIVKRTEGSYLETRPSKRYFHLWQFRNVLCWGP